MSELYKKHRPKLWKDFYGQNDAIKTLKEMVDNSRIPHALLLSGNSGCGKTSAARVLQKKLNCNEHDFFEINCASARGIDTIREIQSRVDYGSMSGGVRIWLLDECFHAETLVSTPFGDMPIYCIKPGNAVFNLSGVSYVRHVFCNKVDLSRVVRMKFNDGSIVFTTKQHEYLTETGWKEAQNLQFEDCILSRVCYPMRKGETNNAKERMSILQRNIFNKQCKTSSLFQKLCVQSIGKSKGKRKNYNQKLSLVQKRIHDQNFSYEGPLFNILCLQDEKQQTRIQEEVIFQRNCSENRSGFNKVPSNKQRKRTFQESFPKNVPIEFRSNNSTESTRDKREEGDSSCLGRRTWREWQNIQVRKNSLGDFIRFGSTMENVSGSFYRPQIQIGEWEIPTSNLLQNRYGNRGIEVGCRSRWEYAHDEISYIQGCKKDSFSRKVRLVHYESYQQGCNDESFQGIITDREKENGFIEFYDLQIEGHPSYFANGLPVHNCQKLTGDAQTALLKPLEDIPNHVYFILATTDPSKLLKTIHTRCTELKFRALTTTELLQLAKSVLEKEKKQESDEVLEALVESADGSARKALVLLDQIIGLENNEEKLNAIRSQDAKRQAWDLIQLIAFKDSKWEPVAKILEAIEEEPETIRRQMLGLATSMLLKGKGNKLKMVAIIDNFECNFFDSGKAGLAKACWNSLRENCK